MYKENLEFDSLNNLINFLNNSLISDLIKDKDDIKRKILEKLDETKKIVNNMYNKLSEKKVEGTENILNIINNQKDILEIIFKNNEDLNLINIYTAEIIKNNKIIIDFTNNLIKNENIRKKEKDDTSEKDKSKNKKNIKKDNIKKTNINYLFF